MIKTLDVTEHVRPLVPSIGDHRVAMSAGSLGVVDNHDEAKRLRLVGALALRVLTDSTCARQQLDERQMVVSPTAGPRFVLIGGASPDGHETIAIVTYWEWAMYAGKALEPEVEVLERDTAAQRMVN